MKHMISLTLAFFILFVAQLKPCISSEKANRPPASPDTAVEQLKTDLQLTKQALQEVRRDQLNYRIEKNLLKEAYSSNIQIINIIILIFLAFLTLIGILGVKSIGTIKKEFQRELEEMRKLREQYEKKFADIEAEQEKAKDLFKELKTSNEKQDKRLNVLEIQEKSISLIKSRNYRRALEYLKVGLDLAPDDIIMLKMKMHCLIEISNFPGALQCGRLILEHEPDDISAIANFAELYLLGKNVADYELLIEKNRSALSEHYSPYLIWYLELMKQYIKNDLDALVGIIKDMLSEKTSGKVHKIKGWVFTQVKSALADDPDSSVKSIFFKCIYFLEGTIDQSELESALNEEKV